MTRPATGRRSQVMAAPIGPPIASAIGAAAIATSAATRPSAPAMSVMRMAMPRTFQNGRPSFTS